MMRKPRPILRALLAVAAVAACTGPLGAQRNIVLIYADDVGYGDLGSYGSRLPTPNLDRLAREGARFTRAHTTSATCTPSRYSLLTGEYAWRKPGTGIATGDASLLIEPGRTTLASLLRGAGYTTAVIGKWHLGLGPPGGPDWNGEIRPGPLEVGFDHAFLIPATGDRVPTVYVEDRRVVGLDPADPIRVSFGAPLPGEPTGRERPELLRLHPSHGHDQTIVNGVSRIGYMSGGRAARWVDEEMADVITGRAVEFIARSRARPFFLFFSTHDIHVPRMPHPRFAGRSGMGPRGDALLQLDWSVGELLDALERAGVAGSTLVMFSSDNGPVLDDGYRDGAVELAGGHRPAGPLRGGKYSAYEAGTRVPFLARWPERIRAGTVSDALISQVDLPATLAALVGARLAPADAPDSFDQSAALLGADPVGRDHLVQQGGPLALVRGEWKLITPGRGARVNANTGIETGSEPASQLYHLAADPGERTNLAERHPERVAELTALLERIRAAGRSRP